MTDSNVITLDKLEQNDPLQEVLREGARKMLAAAIEAEIAIFIEQHSGSRYFCESFYEHPCPTSGKCQSTCRL